MTRSTVPLSLAALAAGIVIATPAAALDRRAYNDAAFQAAQRAGKPILVEVHAPWCPVCAAQGRAIDKLTAGGYRDLTIFRIDFDTQKPLWQKFGARKQSTIIAYQGAKETGRISYVANEASVATLLRSTAR